MKKKLCWSVQCMWTANRKNTTLKVSRIRLGYHSVHRPTRDLGMLQHIQFILWNQYIHFFLIVVVVIVSFRRSPNSLLVSDFPQYMSNVHPISLFPCPRLICPYTSFQLLAESAISIVFRFMITATNAQNDGQYRRRRQQQNIWACYMSVCVCVVQWMKCPFLADHPIYYEFSAFRIDNVGSVLHHRLTIVHVHTYISSFRFVFSVTPTSLSPALSLSLSISRSIVFCVCLSRPHFSLATNEKFQKLSSVNNIEPRQQDPHHIHAYAHAYTSTFTYKCDWSIVNSKYCKKINNSYNKWREMREKNEQMLWNSKTESLL